MVELPGDDHLPFVGDQDAMLDEIEAFLRGVRQRPQVDTALATVLCVRLVGDPPHAADRRGLRGVRRPRGAVVPRAGAARVGGRQLRALRRTGAGDPLRRAAWARSRTGWACASRRACTRASARSRAASRAARSFAIGRQLAAAAAPGEIRVSRTVVDLVAGSGLRFDARGVVRVGEPASEWPVFALAADGTDET